MATAKKKGLLDDLNNLDYMQIISSGSASNIFTENKEADYSYSTGIPLIDYLYGYEMIIRDPNDNFKVIGKRKNLGLQAGSFNVGTGFTGTYKTTVFNTINANIAFKNNGNVRHYDAENRVVLERIKQITKLPPEWFIGEAPRYSLISGAIGFDRLQADIANLFENKMKYKEYLEVDTGLVDSQNRPLKMMPPTILFVDSLQDVICDESKYDVDNKNFDDTKELRGNMVGAQSAKLIRGFITDILPMLKQANIMVNVIAHKTANMSLNPFAPPSKQFAYGSASERISGGTAVEFNASAVINLSTVSGNDGRFFESQDGFNGNAIMIEPTKSSTSESGNNKTGRGYKLIIDKTNNGVDNIRTLVEFLKDKGRLKGNKAGFKVIDKHGNELSEKFTWKKVYKDFADDKETYKAFMIAAKEELESLIAPADEEASGKIDPMDMDSICSSL